MRISRILLGKRLFTYLMKKSFYGQFAGGENISELKPCVENLAQHGVHSMLNFSVESDLDTTVGESQCEESLETILSILDSSKEVCQGRPFSSFKITGLTTPQFLYEFTDVLEGVQRVFLECSVAERDIGGFVSSLSGEVVRGDETLFVNRVITREGFVKIAGSPELFDSVDTGNTGKLDFYQFREILMSNPKIISQIEGIPELTAELVEGGTRLKDRLTQIIKKTKSIDARIMIDAEQTYMQPAIDYFTVELMREHNQGVAYIYNTYQCYLKRTPNTLTLDARDALSRGYTLGVKLVRGAYMVEEAARAARLRYENPVQNSKEETDQAYHNMLDVLLELVSRDHCYMLAGSHNEVTVKYLMSQLQHHNLHPDPRERVVFGQLYGLCDPTTFQLSSSGYTVFKAIAWGPVEAVLPFLARRAQENTGVLGSRTRELDLLKMEIWRRVVRG